MRAVALALAISGCAANQKDIPPWGDYQKEMADKTEKREEKQRLQLAANEAARRKEFIEKSCKELLEWTHAKAGGQLCFCSTEDVIEVFCLYYSSK